MFGFGCQAHVFPPLQTLKREFEKVKTLFETLISIFDHQFTLKIMPISKFFMACN